MKKSVLFIILTVVAAQLFAGNRGAAYTKLGVSAREIALGRCGTTLSSDGSAVYWNPANMLEQDIHRKSLGLSATYMSLPEWDMQYGSFSTGYRFRNWAVGAGALYYQVTDIQHWDEEMNYLGNFNDTEMSGIGGLAFRLSNVMNMGVSLWLQQQSFSLSDTTAMVGLGGQIGFNYYLFPQAGDYKFSINLADSRALSQQWLTEAIDTTDIMIVAGLSGTFHNRGESGMFGPIRFAVELEQIRHYPMELRLGLENEWNPVREMAIYTRLGLDDFILQYSGWDLEENVWGVETIALSDYRRIQTKYTLGLGVVYRPLHLGFDYAMVLEHYRILHFITLKVWKKL